MAIDLSTLCVYVVRNADGLLFRRKASRGPAREWTNDPIEARVYTRLPQARAIVTWWATLHPTVRPPDIIVVSGGPDLAYPLAGEDARVSKVRAKAVADRQAALVRHRDASINRAERDFRQASETLLRMVRDGVDVDP